MGYRIAEEAESRAPGCLTWRERYVLSVLCHVAYDENRRCKQGTTTDPEFLGRVRLSQKELYAVLRSLIDKKALLRIQRGQNGRQAEYAIPEFAQMASHARTTAAARLRQMATSVLIAGQRAIPVPGVAAADPVSADRRVAEAVAYLESARPRQDVLLPAWALTRMFYQLRRHALELLLVILEMHYADADNDDPAPDAAIRGVLGGYDSGTVGARDCMDEIERIMAGDAGVKLAKVVDGQAAALSEPQLDVLGRALADAVTHRDPSGQCNGCDESPAGLCEDHAADLELCESYLALARQLGIEVDW